MKQIKLTRDQFAIVDDVDFEWLNQWKWCVTKAPSTFYAVRQSGTSGKQIGIRMHREILALKKGDCKQVDHINHNGLDNRKSNLRICTNQQNGFNKKINKNSSSIYKGVSWRKWGKWQVRIKYNGKDIHLGYSNNEIDAAKTYDKAALKYFGEFALTNFKVLL